MIRTIAARLVFALAAVCALAASAGVAVPSHEEEPGTPAGHDHVLSAYQFGFLVQLVEHHAHLSPAMSKLHRVFAEAGVPPNALSLMPGMTGAERGVTLPTIKAAALSPIQDLAIEFALLVVLITRLARPARRVVAELRLPGLPVALWRVTPAIVPPRLAFFPHLAA